MEQPTKIKTNLLFLIRKDPVELLLGENFHLLVEALIVYWSLGEFGSLTQVLFYKSSENIKHCPN